STPYMDEASRCHRVGLIASGRLVAEGRPRDLVAGFEHAVVEVEGGDRAAVEDLASTLDGIRGTHPVGSRLRLIVVRGSLPAVTASLERLGATVRPAHAEFEDLFLSKIAESTA